MEVNSTPERTPTSTLLRNQTKYCSWLAAAAMFEGSHFESLEAGTCVGNNMCNMSVEMLCFPDLTQGEELLIKE